MQNHANFQKAVTDIIAGRKELQEKVATMIESITEKHRLMNDKILNLLAGDHSDQKLTIMMPAIEKLIASNDKQSDNAKEMVKSMEAIAVANGLSPELVKALTDQSERIAREVMAAFTETLKVKQGALDSAIKGAIAAFQATQASVTRSPGTTPATGSAQRPALTFGTAPAGGAGATSTQAAPTH
jgi:uncharacterized protein YfkK (UPF0435 family)